MTSRRWLGAAGLGLLLVAGAVFSAVVVANAADSARSARFREAASIEAERVRNVVELAATEAERLAAISRSRADFGAAAPPRLDHVDEVVALAYAELDGPRLVVRTALPRNAGPLSTGEDLLVRPELELVLTRAVTEADTSAGTPIEIEGREVLIIAAPVLSDPLAAEAARRASVTGAVIAVLDGARILDEWPGAARLVAPDGRAIGPQAAGDLHRSVIDLTGRPFELLLDEPALGWSDSARLVLVGGTLSAILVAIVLFHQTTRRREAEEHAEQRSQQLTRIAEAGARLQQSLDLSELLPAFAVSLANDFELRSVAIALLDDDGMLTEVFSTGERAPGGAIELPLRRGWRAVGLLTIGPGRELDEAELTSLQALGDLLAVAMSNAQLYEREQASAARLRDLDALKNAFLGTVSHELRTSMTAIMGFGELLSDAWDTLDDTRRREMANRIRRSAGSLRHLVDDLLDFARLEQERLRVSPRRVDLAGVVRQMIDTLSPLLGRHTLDLRTDDAVSAWADPIAIERILANLVSNAAKYSPDGTTITVSVEPRGSAARLVVADQGPGIPAAERRRIFARFYRLDTPEAVRTRGAGIGLAILRDFAERSGATVTVDDAPGGGARFVVDFPTEPMDVGSAEAVAVGT